MNGVKGDLIQKDFTVIDDALVVLKVKIVLLNDEGVVMFISKVKEKNFGKEVTTKEKEIVILENDAKLLSKELSEEQNKEKLTGIFIQHLDLLIV